jgi:hypothetical protein
VGDNGGETGIALGTKEMVSGCMRGDAAATSAGVAAADAGFDSGAAEAAAAGSDSAIAFSTTGGHNSDQRTQNDGSTVWADSSDDTPRICWTHIQ